MKTVRESSTYIQRKIGLIEKLLDHTEEAICSLNKMSATLYQIRMQKGGLNDQTDKMAFELHKLKLHFETQLEKAHQKLVIAITDETDYVPDQTDD